MDDEEDLFSDDGALAELLSSGLGGGPTPEAIQQSTGILESYQKRYGGEQPSPAAAFIEQLRSSADARLEVLRRSRERVLAQRYNPGEALLAASEALGRPTKSGTLAEVMSNVSGSLRDPLSRRREFSRQRDDLLSQLELQEAGIRDPVTSAELQLAELEQRLAAGLAGKSLDVLKRGSGTGRNSRLEAEIRSGMAQLIAMGVDPLEAYNRATNIAFGREKLELSEDLGVAVITDSLGRTITEIPIGAAGQAPAQRPGQQPPTGGAPPIAATTPTGRTPAGEPSDDPRDVQDPRRQTIYQSFGSGTGLWSGIGAGFNVVAGNVGVPILEGVEESRQSIRSGAQRMLRALSVDPDDPAAREIDRIREEINILPSIANNPAVARVRSRAIDADLRDLYRRAVVDAADTSLSVDRRRQRENLASEIRNFLPVFGVPPEREGDVPVPLGLPPDVEEMWQYMTEEGRELARRMYAPTE